MVDFFQLQETITELLEQDRAIKSIEASAPTLETAVSEAALLLDIPVRRLEYEIIEKGSPGFLGTGKKDWKIRAYERVYKKKNTIQADLFEDAFAVEAPVIEDKDGQAYVQLIPEGAFLKVTPPLGKGLRATEAHAMQNLSDRHVKDIDTALVEQTVREAAEVYVKVGAFDRMAANNVMVNIEIIENEMKAVMQVSPPGPGGCDMTFENYVNLLKSNKVYYGIKEDFLREFADAPKYNEKIEVAEGFPAINGKDAHMKYNFKTDQTKVHLRENSSGRVDFKELSIIQNVFENQLLAVKVPLEEGVQGKTVTGKTLPANRGKDISLPKGKNVHEGEDGASILADMNGQVLMVDNKINVEPVYTVDGGVNLKTGHVVFLGTVIVNGNVEDGFQVKATGNIEVNGTVAKAELDAEGDIIINQGINGKGGGTVRAGKTLWARFIENATVEAGNMVVAQDGIINSQVDAFNRIICQGKRACIMGGRLRASEEINAKVLGNSTSGTETICEVGFDPQSKQQLSKLHASRDALEKELEIIKRDLQTLINIKKQRKTLPEDKEANLEELMDRRQEVIAELKKTNGEIEKLNQYLNTLTIRGRVSASSKVYPGVKILIRDVKEDVRTEYKAVTFVLENGLIRVVKYEEPDDSVKKGPDGYTTH